MKCRKRKRKGSRKSGNRVRGVVRGRKCCGREMEWRKHVGSEAEWRKQKWKWKHGSEDIIKVRKAKGGVGGRKKPKFARAKSEVSVL